VPVIRSWRTGRCRLTDRSIGLLLPCSVVVRAAGDGTLVEALDPRVIAAVAGHPELERIAEDAAARLWATLDALPPA
jgi:uncharacterized protein (DUF302 family)